MEEIVDFADLEKTFTGIGDHCVRMKMLTLGLLRKYAGKFTRQTLSLKYFAILER